MRRLIVILASAALLTGCAGGGGGGGSGASGDAAKLVPANALAFVAVNTDFSSSQLQNAGDIVDKFPIKDRAIRAIAKELQQQGADLEKVKSSVGPEVDVAAITVGDKTEPVGFAKPDDEQTFEQQLSTGSSPPKFAQIDGYTVFADSQAGLDAVTNRAGNLSDSQTYKDALATLPGDAIARAYVSPLAIGKAKTLAPGAAAVPLNTSSVRWIAGALTANDGAFKLEVHVKGIGAGTEQASSSLVEQIPSGALIALSLNGAGELAAGADTALKQAQSAIGFDLQGLLQALGSETIAYVKPGIPFPEVTIATKSADSARGLAAVNALIAQLQPNARRTTVVVGGVTLQSFELGPVTIYAGRSGDELVVSDSRDAIGELKGSGPKLVDDSEFKAAKEGAGMGDASQGFLFVNVKDSVPAAEAIAQLAGATIPAEVDANLKPLRALLAYGSHDGDVQTFVAFLSTS